MNRPNFNLVYSFAGLTTLTAIAACRQPDRMEAKPYNIVYIMTDDHTAQMMSCYDTRYMETPNLDRIANDGVRFTNSFVANSLSGPSRACMITGKHSCANGFYDNTTCVFDSAQQTFPKLLQKAGYQTALVGKWHLESLPSGFDYWEILPGQGDYYNPDFITQSGGTVRKQGYVTNIITDEAIDWMENKRDKEKPFCMLIHHKAIHRNWMADTCHLALYEDKTFPLPENFFDDYEGRPAAAAQEMSIAKDMDMIYDLKMLRPDKDSRLKSLYERFLGRMNAEQRAAWERFYGPVIEDFYKRNPKGEELANWKFQRYMRDYMKTVKSLDDNVGRVLDYLEEKGMLDNTLVVYTSDQGFYMGEHGWFDKRFMYEESMRTPLIMRLPKGFNRRGDVTEMVQNIDYAPTFLELAGVEVPEDIQGLSLLPLLKGEQPADWRKALYYHFYEYPAEHMVKRHYGIRTERYKLIHFYNDIDWWELYDVQNDPTEMKNLYGDMQYNAVMEQLKTELVELQEQYNDSVRFSLTDYTRGLSIWFDTPNNLDGKAIWTRADGTRMNPDPAWENSSLPIGNGSLGANVMGSVTTERITLNEKTLWKGGPNTAGGADYYWNVNKPSAPMLGEIRQAFAEEDYRKAEKLTREHFNGLAEYEEEDESPFRFGAFTTMGELYVETGLNEVGMSGYYRALSLDSAMAVVNFKKDGTRYLRKFFISYPDSVMVMKFATDGTAKQNLTLSYCPNTEARSTMRADGNDGLLYTGVLDNNGMKFVIRMKALPKGGEVTVQDGRILIREADEVVFLLTADTDYRMNFNPDFRDPKAFVGDDPEKTTRERMDKAARKGYDELYRNHETDYTALFNRVKLQLNPDQGSRNMPTGRRLENYRKGIPDYRLEELYYQFGRYLLIASSRPGNMPANLQGVWHNNLNGPWRVDYHNNINIQMNYWPACSTHLEECALPLIDFIRSLVKPGEKTAQAYFGARGWTASISANIFGFTAPLSSEDMAWNFNPMAGPWLATHVWEYYDYTRDRKFLEETGYELLKSSAQFVTDYLWQKPDGTYTAAPSTSPEHGPVDEGATFVHAVAREILLDAVEASRVLGVDKEERKRWESVLKHLAPYRIGRYGQLMEWSKDIDDPKDEHRHVNHLFGLHPGHTVSPIATPELARAARVVLEHRGDGATGWSMGWKLNQWARLLDGNRAYKLYGNLLKNGTLDNLWDTHPPFQIDGNLGGTAGITEMLLQSHLGFIHLLPALPDAWADGTVSGVCARGGFEVAMAWKDSELTEAVVTSDMGEPCTVRYGDNVLSFKTKKGCSYRITVDNGELKAILNRTKKM